ncbi:hypothetical protein KDL29_09770 [bacterium]|nr:hypothetical protein [bacterium]
MISTTHKLIIDELRELSRPLYHHYSRGEYKAALAVVEGLMSAERLAALDIDRREVQGCYLLLMHVAMRQYDEHAWDCEILESVIARLEVPCETVLGNHQRISSLLQLRVLVNDECGMLLGREEFEEMLSHPQLLDLSPNLWDSVGLYAYRNGFQDLLETSFESVTIAPGKVMPQESWQRLNLLLQLYTGRTTRRDVEEYIRLMRMVPQIEEFRQVMLPAIEQAGLWDGELELEVQKRYDIAARDGYTIRLEKKTGQILGRGHL